MAGYSAIIGDTKIMKVNGREIGPSYPPYIIAEVSCNHGGSLKRALELISAAKDYGADAVKFQCVTADTITIDCNRPEFVIQDGPWKGRNLHELYRWTETPFHWFSAIAEQADKVGITWFASVFDKTAVDLMDFLEAPAIKIASFEIVDIPLIKYAAATGKPMIISTGMASYEEVTAAVPRDMKLNGLALLHCVSGYPAPASEANLHRMSRLRDVFSYWGHDQVVGLSDHSTGTDIAVAATALGASIIEKHFRLLSHPDTEDSAFSLDQWNFAEMAHQVRRAWTAIQTPEDSPSQDAHRPLRRSLFVVEDIKQGEVFTERNVRSIRPGHGLPPAAIDAVIGKHAKGDIDRGTPLEWCLIS